MAGLAIKGVGMLFGHQNDDMNQTAQDAPAASDLGTPPVPQAVAGAPGVNPLAVDEVTGAPLPAVTDNLQTGSGSLAEEPAQQPVTEISPDLAGPSPEAPTDLETVAGPSSPEPALEATHSASSNDDLLSLKQQALSQLSPLVTHLDQSPEEKFRTTMMLIQSTDDQSLLKAAYDAAQAIPDEKARAQALLDVVNEINYFTQQKAN